MNALPRIMRELIVRRCGTIGYNMKLQMLLLRREVIMKNRTKWELSALASSRSLNEQTAVESQINCLYLTSSWCRHHNTALGSKSCIRRTQCHQGCFMAIWIFVCLLLYSTRLAPRLTFRWWIGEKDHVQQICMQEPPCQLPSVARHALLHWFWYDIILVGQM